jgi:glycosyltransferase involved in cell wall biosynthesis
MLNAEELLADFTKEPIEEYPNTVLADVPEPVISVWVIVYNQIDYVRTMMDSLMAQVVDVPYEIVAGDDESTDGTREIMIEYAKKYPGKIRLFLHKRANNIRAVTGNATPNYQATFLWAKARGKYIAMLEGDDYWIDPRKLQKQAEFLDTNPRNMGVSTNFKVVGVQNETIKSQKYDIDEPVDFKFHYATVHRYISKTVAVMYRNIPEITRDLPKLILAPLLDQLLFSLYTSRGPTRILPDVTAAFRFGSGYYSPSKHQIGLDQRVDEWSIISDYFKGTPFYLVPKFRLHTKIVQLLRNKQIKNPIEYFTSRIPSHFDTSWFNICKLTKPEEVPLSLYAPLRDEGNHEFGHVKSHQVSKIAGDV